MTILEHTEFNNSHGDKVDVRLVRFVDGYQVIVNVEMHRRDTEKRFHKGKIVELSVYKFTQEVKVTKTTVERTALVEYNMARTLQGDPSLTMAEFQSWLSTTEQSYLTIPTEKESND